MSNKNTEAINNVKNKISESMNKVLNNETAQKVLSRIDEDKKRIMAMVSKNPAGTIGTILGIIIVLFYFIVLYNRINRYIGRMSEYAAEDTDIKPLDSNLQVMNGNFKLCDFWIASSYKSYLPCTNYYDYASPVAIKQCLKYGARYIDLDIFNADFNQCTDPVVCWGQEAGNWHYTTSFAFIDACKVIYDSAFTTFVTNPKDPLFLNLRFHTEGNVDTINKCAKILKEIFKSRLLKKKYSYQGRFTSTNIATTPIKRLLDKIIISCESKVEGTDMDELTNMHLDYGSNMRIMTDIEVKNTYDANELKEFNKRNITKVLPSFDGRTKENFNFFTPYYLGCQIICMNYTEPTPFMKAYIRRFKDCSFKLKPYKLRYRPIYIKPPLKQTKKVSFAPKKKTTPYYSITY
jgi:hypothetical protein